METGKHLRVSFPGSHHMLPRSAEDAGHRTVQGSVEESFSTWASRKEQECLSTLGNRSFEELRCHPEVVLLEVPEEGLRGCLVCGPVTSMSASHPSLNMFLKAIHGAQFQARIC